MPTETICPHCEGNIPEKFLQDAEKDRKIKCPLCKQTITINQEGEIVPRSGSFGEGTIISA